MGNPLLALAFESGLEALGPECWDVVEAAAHPLAQAGGAARLLAFYGELVERLARPAAAWMAAGFTHGVLNTDSMSLVGESFDYGPFAFRDRWDPRFTAADFDHAGLYAYGQQPAITHGNRRRRLGFALGLEPGGPGIKAAPATAFTDREGTDPELPDPVLPTLQRWNLPEPPVRPVIERIWEAIDQRDDWQPFHAWLAATTVPAG